MSIPHVGPESKFVLSSKEIPKHFENVTSIGYDEYFN